MDNYPDDIRDYDGDPRSPFYVEPPMCDECGHLLSVDADSDGETQWSYTFCENPDCTEKGEIV